MENVLTIFHKILRLTKMLKGMIRMGGKKQKDLGRGKYSLTSTQEVLYQRDFKMADRAGGFNDSKTKL
jgi:YfhE-like protein